MVASVVAREQAVTEINPTFASARKGVVRRGHFGAWSAAASMVALVSLSGCAISDMPGNQHAPVQARGLHPVSVQMPAPPPAPPGTGAQRLPSSLSAASAQLAESIVLSGDNRQLPFVVIDKVAATVAAFDARGHLVGLSPALLGSARGDDSVPGIGERPIAKILPHERTTPAGRFIAETGRNMQGEDIVWIDYDAAVSLHRVRATNASERRLQRLASPSPLDNRISYGCVNIPARYFDAVIKPLMRGGKAVVYVLPEVRSVEDVFAFVRDHPPTQTGKHDQNGNRAKWPG